MFRQQGQEVQIDKKDRDARRQKAQRILVPTATIVVLLLIWEAVVDFGLVPSYMLPSPTQVVAALVADIQLLMSNAATTLLEAAFGLGIGIVLGFLVAVLMDRFNAVDLALNPLVTISQTIPTVAIAPLLVLWFGYGLMPKVLLVILTTFFPITISFVQGLRSVDPEMLDLMRTLNATRWQVFWHVKFPAALPYFFSGLRISATYAIVGAVVAEWLGGFSGLGVYMTRVRKSFSYDKMFAVIIVISLLSLALMWLVGLIERVSTPWQQIEKDASK